MAIFIVIFDDRWQYFASETGMFRVHPGMSWSSGTGHDFEPRLQPWYAGRFNGADEVVVIIDTSSSMRGRSDIILTCFVCAACILFVCHYHSMYENGQNKIIDICSFIIGEYVRELGYEWFMKS